MVAELNFLEVWIPEQMQPGTMFMLEQAGELGKVENPYWARYAAASLRPAIFAIAYASFVVSRGPVSKYSSLIG